jgi:hypothetical protein
MGIGVAQTTYWDRRRGHCKDSSHADSLAESDLTVLILSVVLHALLVWLVWKARRS